MDVTAKKEGGPGAAGRVQDPGRESFKNNDIFKLVIKSGKPSRGGNPARDHLANERTLLAYIRTGLNFVLFGLILLQLAKYVVIAPLEGLHVDPEREGTARMAIYNELMAILHPVNRFSKPIGALVFSLALATLVFGGVRYLRLFQLLFSRHDEFESGLAFSLLIFLGAITIYVLAFVYSYKF